MRSCSKNGHDLFVFLCISIFVAIFVQSLRGPDDDALGNNS